MSGALDLGPDPMILDEPEEVPLELPMKAPPMSELERMQLREAELASLESYQAAQAAEKRPAGKPMAS